MNRVPVISDATHACAQKSGGKATCHTLQVNYTKGGKKRTRRKEGKSGWGSVEEGKRASHTQTHTHAHAQREIEAERRNRRRGERGHSAHKDTHPGGNNNSKRKRASMGTGGKKIHFELGRRRGDAAARREEERGGGGAARS